MTIINMTGGSGGMSKEEFLEVSTPAANANDIPCIKSSYYFSVKSPSYSLSSYQQCTTGNKSIVVKGDYPYIQKYYYTYTASGPSGYRSSQSITDKNPDDSNWFKSPNTFLTIPAEANTGTITAFIGLTCSSSRYGGYFFVPNNVTEVKIPFYRDDSGVHLDYTELNTISLKTAFSNSYVYGWATGESYYPSAIMSKMEYE